jgi:hypothetical protein
VRRAIGDPLPRSLVALTFATGLADAVCFLGLGQVLVANRTGNVVFLAFAVAGASGPVGERRRGERPPRAVIGLLARGSATPPSAGSASRT